MDQYLEYLERIDQLSRQSRRFKSYEAREDMERMINPVRVIAQQLSQELVECRRLRRMTVRAETLEAKLQQSLDNAEKMLMYAQLRYS
jgi:predicted DNA-binding protein